MTEQEITEARLRILKMLESSYPLGLKDSRIEEGLLYAAFKLTPAERAMHLTALVDAEFVKAERDLLNQAESLYYFTEKARVYMRSKGF